MTVDVERVDRVAVVTMNRPDTLNTFTPDHMARIRDTFLELAQDNELRAIVLTGAGDRAFAAGADIAAMAEYSREEGMEFGRLGHAMTNAVEITPQPVIAAVNGFALGGGCEIALACDVRIASDNAVFAQPEVSLGIPPGWGGSQRLPRAVGPALAAELIFMGRRVTADEAFRIGLVNDVVSLEALHDRALDTAEAIARNSGRAVREAKRLMRLAFSGDPDAGLAAELESFGQAFETPDQIEGMSAFLEKRTATFSS